MRAWPKRDVLAFLDRVEPVLRRMDHFDLLDVGVDATDSTIQAAFHGMAAALHPDRHRRELSPTQVERLTIVYARIAEAYRVLRDPPLRAAYVREAARALAERQSQPASERGRPTTGAPPPATSPADGDGLDETERLTRINPKAQSHYRRAQAALRTGDRSSALLSLRMALAAHPTSTLIREALVRLEGKK